MLLDITDCLGIPTCLFNVIFIDLVWVTFLLQSITDCFRRSCKTIKKSLLHLDIGGHGGRSTMLFCGHRRCYDCQWPLTGRYFKLWNWIVDHFSLTFVNLSLTLMLYFHLWLQINGKILMCREYYSQFGICKRSRVSLLEQG